MIGKQHNKKQGLSTPRLHVGFLPCFSHYLYDRFPLDDFYRNSTFVTKISQVLQQLPTCNNPLVDLKQMTGCQSIMQIVPDSNEGKRIIQMCSWSDGKIYRLDFGKNKMRVILGLYDDGKKRLCFFFGFDAEHSTYPIGKTVR